MTVPVRPVPGPSHGILDVLKGLGDVGLDVVRAPLDLARTVGDVVFGDPSPEEASNPLMQASRTARYGTAVAPMRPMPGAMTPQAKAGAVAKGLVMGPVHQARTVLDGDAPTRDRVRAGGNLALLAAPLAVKGAGMLPAELRGAMPDLANEMGALRIGHGAPDMGVLKRMVSEGQIQPHEVPAIVKGDAPFVPRAPKFNHDVLTKAFNAPEGAQVGVLGDFLVGPKVRALYADVLDVPIRKLTSPDFHGAFGDYDGQPTIFLDAASGDKTIPVLLEEAAHAMRVVGRGRVDAPQSLGPSFDFDAYQALPAEQSAARLVQHAMRLQEDPLTPMEPPPPKVRQVGLMQALRNTLDQQGGR